MIAVEMVLVGVVIALGVVAAVAVCLKRCQFFSISKNLETTLNSASASSKKLPLGAFTAAGRSSACLVPNSY